MSKNERRAYLEQIRARYAKAKRADKTRILDEFCAVCAYNRKYTLRLLSARSRQRTGAKTGRKPEYHHPELLNALQRMLRYFTEHPQQPAFTRSCRKTGLFLGRMLRDVFRQRIEFGTLNVGV